MQRRDYATRETSSVGWLFWDCLTLDAHPYMRGHVTGGDYATVDDPSLFDKFCTIEALGAPRSLILQRQPGAGPRPNGRPFPAVPYRAHSAVLREEQPPTSLHATGSLAVVLE